jgi:hypothetical protein
MLQDLIIALLFSALSLYGLIMTDGTAALNMIESRIPALQRIRLLRQKPSTMTRTSGRRFQDWG